MAADLAALLGVVVAGVAQPTITCTCTFTITFAVVATA